MRSIDELSNLTKLQCEEYRGEDFLVEIKVGSVSTLKALPDVIQIVGTRMVDKTSFLSYPYAFRFNAEKWRKTLLKVNRSDVLTIRGKFVPASKDTLDHFGDCEILTKVRAPSQ